MAAFVPSAECVVLVDGGWTSRRGSRLGEHVSLVSALSSFSCSLTFCFSLPGQPGRRVPEFGVVKQSFNAVASLNSKVLRTCMQNERRLQEVRLCNMKYRVRYSDCEMPSEPALSARAYRVTWKALRRDWSSAPISHGAVREGAPSQGARLSPGGRVLWRRLPLHLSLELRHTR